MDGIVYKYCNKLCDVFFFGSKLNFFSKFEARNALIWASHSRRPAGYQLPTREQNWRSVRIPFVQAQGDDGDARNQQQDSKDLQQYSHHVSNSPGVPMLPLRRPAVDLWAGRGWQTGKFAFVG